MAEEQPPGLDIEKLANALILKDPPLPLVRQRDETPAFINAIDVSLTRAWRRGDPMVLLPNLHDHAESIAVFSDYGGDQGRHRTYSFLLVGWNLMQSCIEQLKLVRDRHGLNRPYKEVAYKTMGYGPQARALDDFLGAAERAPGLLFNLIVEDDVASLIAENSKKSHEAYVEVLRDAGLGTWKAAVAERLLRIVHLSAYLTALLAREGHKVVWMTDNDAIMPNQALAERAADLFQRALGFYARTEFETIGWALPFQRNEGEPDLRDLLSIADLAAGSVAEFYDARRASGDPNVKEGTAKVLRWVFRQGLALKRLSAVVRAQGNGVTASLVVPAGAPPAGVPVVRISV